VELLANQSTVKKWQNWRIRALWSIVMILSFFLILAMGHFWVLMLIIFVQGLMYKEIIAIAYVPSKELKLPWFRTINWYFLTSTTYFLYGESLSHYFKQPLLVDAFLQHLAMHHRFISFVLYVIGFVLFVANLKKGHYKFQFSQFAWTHMTLLLVTAQSHFVVNNLFEGMFWLFIPASLVVTNDIFAYICGFFFGRTPLIRLSPKKTVEGFIGGWMFTLLWGVIFTQILLKMPYMLCPAHDLTENAWNYTMCELNPVFVSQRYHLKPWMTALLNRTLFSGTRDLWIAPIQFHVFLLGCFASLIAPFGGFFASGVKRAFKIKDFGDSIPGHGGLTDRMDCQFIMGVFSYMYYQSFLRPSTLSVGAVLQTIVTGLSTSRQLELYYSLQQYLQGQEMIE
jgi:phosphatidate cytidylyltransferase